MKKRIHTLTREDCRKGFVIHLKMCERLDKMKKAMHASARGKKMTDEEKEKLTKNLDLLIKVIKKGLEAMNKEVSES